LRRLWCWLALFSVSLSLSASPRYDLAFKHWGEFYFPAWDWRWWRAQGMAESGLDQSAVSPAGALGVMQLMPETAREMGVDPLDAEENIRGGIKFDRWLWQRWSRVSDATERRNLMFASYNAGPANIEAAACGSTIWARVARALPRITGRRAAETVAYVARIDALMGVD
jgi:soluble lytic murein transglycosylase-like protein